MPIGWFVCLSTRFLKSSEVHEIFGRGRDKEQSVKSLAVTHILRNIISSLHIYSTQNSSTLLQFASCQQYNADNFEMSLI